MNWYGLFTFCWVAGIAGIIIGAIATEDATTKQGITLAWFILYAGIFLLLIGGAGAALLS